MVQLLSTSGKIAVASFAISSSMCFAAVAPPAQISIPTAKESNRTNIAGKFVPRTISSSPGQAYFWTEKWQAGERAASEDIHHGRTEKFDSAEAAIAWLFNETA